MIKDIMYIREGKRFFAIIGLVILFSILWWAVETVFGFDGGTHGNTTKRVGLVVSAILGGVIGEWISHRDRKGKT